VYFVNVSQVSSSRWCYNPKATVRFIERIGNITSSGCGWRRWPPAMEHSCEYIEKEVTGRGPQAWKLGMGLTNLHHKKIRKL
jgi:hypothetical protein